MKSRRRIAMPKLKDRFNVGLRIQPIKSGNRDEWNGALISFAQQQFRVAHVS